MESQSCIVEDVIVYQDNQSAILLETNGQKSVGKGTRHVQIKYFFVTDKIKNDEMKVIYCPTKEMIADFYTKPLQGMLFKVHRNAIQGINDDDMPLYLKQYAESIESKNIDWIYLKQCSQQECVVIYINIMTWDVKK